MRFEKVACTNCGAPVEWDGSYSHSIQCPYCQTTFRPLSSPEDAIWMMTDPVARARYEFEGKLDKLEHDIRFEVLRGGTYSDTDRAYLDEVVRLEREGKIRKLASFFSVSPHPSIYRAKQAGEIRLGDRVVPFRKGQEICWACPMTRDRFELDIPVLVADFEDTRVQMLCGQMVNAMQGRMG